MTNKDKLIYQFNKTEDNRKKFLSYDGKEYPLNDGYKTIKKLNKKLKNMNNAEDEIEETEEILIDILGAKAYEKITGSDDFTLEDFSNLTKIVLAAVQGVEPDDMEDFFQGLENNQ